MKFKGYGEQEAYIFQHVDGDVEINIYEGQNAMSITIDAEDFQDLIKSLNFRMDQHEEPL